MLGALIQTYNWTSYACIHNYYKIANCNETEIRLVGGDSDREGRVEVCVGGRWGTVQINNPGELAQTVCESTAEYLEYYSTASCYGRSTLIITPDTFIFIDIVSQFGYSLSKPVYECSLNNNSELMCQEVSVSHDSDLAVVCGNSIDPLSNTNCRLVEEDLEQELAMNCFSYEQLIANNGKFSV